MPWGYASKIFEIVDKHNLETIAMLTIVNIIYPSVQIMLQIKRPPWPGLKGEDICDWMLNNKLKLNDDKKCVLD